MQLVNHFTSGIAYSRLICVLTNNFGIGIVGELEDQIDSHELVSNVSLPAAANPHFTVFEFPYALLSGVLAWGLLA